MVFRNMFVTRTIAVTPIESFVIDHDSFVSCRDSSGQRCYPHPMGKRRAKREELDRLIGPWLDDYERTSRAAKK
jgi:hypothetical protein